MPTATTEQVPLTGGELARRLGCHHTTVSRWRNGHRVPGVHLLDRIRDVTGIPYEEIFDAWSKGHKEWGRFFRMRILGEPR